MSDEQPIFTVRKSDIYSSVVTVAFLALCAYVLAVAPCGRAVVPTAPSRCVCGPRCNCPGTGSTGAVAPKGAVINELRIERPKGPS